MAGLVALVAGPPTLASSPTRHWAWTADVGVPDALHAGVAWRPVRPLRVSVTVATNALSPGARLSVALKVPWDVGPVVAVDAGHFVPGDATRLLSKIAGDPVEFPLLERVGYSWASVHAGLEFGDPKASFFVHAGMTDLRAPITTAQAWMDAELGPSAASIETPRLRVVGPSARMGVVFYFKEGDR